METPMKMRHFLLGTVAVLAASLALSGYSSSALAQAAAKLSGQVTSAEEGNMEGVVVSAKKARSTITIAVVSDAQGNFSFPAQKIEPGEYALHTRAIGFE